MLSMRLGAGKRLGPSDEERRDHNHAIAHAPQVLCLHEPAGPIERRTANLTLRWAVLHETGKVAVYSDGSAIKTPFLEKAAWGIVDTDGGLCGGQVTANPANEERVGATRPTMMSAELTAILKLLEWGETRHARLPITTLWMCYDSQEAAAQSTGTHRGKEHSQLQDRIHRALARRCKLQVAVLFHHVKGHSGDPGNDAADWVAGNALKEDPALEGDTPRPMALVSRFDGLGVASITMRLFCWTPCRAFCSEILPEALRVTARSFPRDTQTGSIADITEADTAAILEKLQWTACWSGQL